MAGHDRESPDAAAKSTAPTANRQPMTGIDPLLPVASVGLAA